MWFMLYILMFSVGYTSTFVVATNISDIVGVVKEFICSHGNTQHNIQEEGSQHKVFCDEDVVVVHLCGMCPSRCNN